MPVWLEWTFKISSGLLWTAVYALIIRRGFKEKTYGMPVAALCANLAWEFVFSFIYKWDAPQNIINVVWLLFDLVILYQVIRYGTREGNSPLPPGLFYAGLAFGLAVAIPVIILMAREFNDFHGKYSAFGQNFMMSVLFIGMLAQRGSSRGQSLYIALFKFVGTLLPCILCYVKHPDLQLLNFVYIAIFVADVAYLFMLHRCLRREGINPWTRL